MLIQNSTEFDELREVVNQHLIRYGGEFFPSFILSARGAYIFDENNRPILDFTSGQACATLGHNHPAIIKAMQRSGEGVIHLFSGMLAPAVAKLAKQIAKMLPPQLQKLIVLNSGSESNETALKIAKMNTGGFEIIGLGGSWHGVTAGSGAASYARDRRGYGPKLAGNMAIPEPNCYRCPIKHCRDACDLTCLEVGFEMFDMQSVGSPAAMIAEPILSAGGILVPPSDYFKVAKVKCEERGMLLIFDEAQTAFGRVETNFAFEQMDVVPDIVTVSKTLSAGLPLAATITSAKIEEDCYQKGFSHYTSHVSDPLLAEVGLAVLDVIEKEKLIENCREMGAYLKAGLCELKERHEVIGDVRGRGLLLGVELVKNRETREPNHEMGAKISKRCLQLGLNMNIRRAQPGRGAVWRIAPPLSIAKDEIDSALTIFDQAITECLNSK